MNATKTADTFHDLYRRHLIPTAVRLDVERPIHTIKTKSVSYLVRIWVWTKVADRPTVNIPRVGSDTNSIIFVNKNFEVFILFPWLHFTLVTIDTYWCQPNAKGRNHFEHVLTSLQLNQV